MAKGMPIGEAEANTIKIKIWRDNCCGSGTSEYELSANADLDQWLSDWDNDAPPELKKYTVWAFPGEIERPTLDDLIMNDEYFGPDEGCGEEDCPMSPEEAE
jgi:hypothetical protein